MEHSTLPWFAMPIDNIRKNGRGESLEILNGSGDCISQWTEEELCEGICDQDQANIEYIVKTANAFPKLVDSVKKLMIGCKLGEKCLTDVMEMFGKTPVQIDYSQYEALLSELGEL